ncbi:MAG: epoxyqueuosine reductase [marine bacterium B5-7]|nr:MAG: epoxyqueuosine reductase [marine bacterium B5-7]
MYDHKSTTYLDDLTGLISAAATEFGFASFGVAGVDIEAAGLRLKQWLDNDYHGTMDYMQVHGSKRYRAAELVPGTVRCLSFTMDYLPESMDSMEHCLDTPNNAYIARYALGRDYHKYMRRSLQKLVNRIIDVIGPFGYRVFTDSAPVMEKPLAANAGLGWIGKHTNLINKRRGSWFFIGEIYTDLPLPVSAPVEDHCGTCTRCIDVCPTRAIIAPYVLDARRCIAYLTIENRGDIPEPLRPLIGNRIFGCDDCQLFCPWNRFATVTDNPVFKPRHDLEDSDLVELFGLDEAGYQAITEGSALRRPGYDGWLRNIAVALGNAPHSTSVIDALTSRSDNPSAMVRRHVAWALARHEGRYDNSNNQK